MSPPHLPCPPSKPPTATNSAPRHSPCMCPLWSCVGISVEYMSKSEVAESSHAPHGMCVCLKVKVLVTQPCPTLCDPIGCSPPGFSVHGIHRQEYWSGLPFPTPGLPDPRITPLSGVSCFGRRVLYHCTTGEALTSPTVFVLIIFPFIPFFFTI